MNNYSNVCGSHINIQDPDSCRDLLYLKEFRAEDDMSGDLIEREQLIRSFFGTPVQRDALLMACKNPNSFIKIGPTEWRICLNEKSTKLKAAYTLNKDLKTDEICKLVFANNFVRGEMNITTTINIPKGTTIRQTKSPCSTKRDIPALTTKEFKTMAML